MNTILVLASEPVIRRVICKALKSKGYYVLPASDVGSAADRLKEFTPDLLMVRHYTESLSGHEAAMYLRRMCPGIPVLLVGGLLEDVGLENREILQEFEIFPKPFKATELLDKVREVLAKFSPGKKAECNSG
jgi:DNA-binding response OmpR family regulator